MIRKNKTNIKNNVNGKKFFLFVLATFIIWFSFTLFVEGNELKVCKDKDFSNCGCPIEKTFIENKHVLLVDITDPVPEGKREDLSQLISSFGTTNEGLFKWISNGRKSDLLTVALVGSKTPSETVPLVSLCKFPPKISMFMLGDLESNLKKNFEKLTEYALLKVYEGQKKTESRIVETTAVFTSSSAYWNKGSALILASDLRENSTQCGLFEISEVVSLDRLSPFCKQIFENLRFNMNVSNSSKPSRAFICRFDAKDPKAGLKKYWDDIFYNSTGVNPVYTCDMSEVFKILDSPYSSLVKEKNK
jgi:hypothetical protein